jgi:DNA repair exonuclease SbcCD ATPase subunit
LREYARNIVTKSELKRELLESQEYQMQASILLQDNGIKAKIIKQYIPVINKMVNKYLDSLDFFVGFHLDENFNEVIKSRYRDTFTYESFSDGQKRRIDMALLLTWRDVAKAKNSINTNLLFLDEADGPLDGVGADMLMELYKISDIKNVFIISHKEGLANTADRVVSFELKNNFTILKDD